MKYFTSKEIRNEKRGEISGVLSRHAGKNIRDGIGIKILSEYLNCFSGGKDSKLLDIGTSSGEFANQLKQNGFENVSGVDLDDYRAAENRKLFKEFKTADLSFDKIPWPDNHFQIVTAWCVLPHLENPFHAIREIHRVLDKQAGVFIFSIPHLSSKASRDYFLKNRDFASYRASNNHITILTPNIVSKTILKYFELIGIEYHARQKIFERGIKGKLLGFVYRVVYKYPPLKKALEKRWAYNMVYILRPRMEPYKS